MAISLSGYNIQKKKQSIADKLAGQTQDLQKEPWWKTVGSIGLPLLASLAMPGIGTALAGWAGAGSGASALASIFGTGSKALKAINLLGKGLQVGAKGQGILSTLGGIGTKTAFNMGVKGLTKGGLNIADKRSVDDLNLTDREMLYGRNALKTLKGQYTDAKDAEKETDIAGSILSAISSQGWGNVKDAFGVGLLNKSAPKGVSMLEGLASSGVEGAKKTANVQQLMGNEPSNLQQIMSGQKMITDPNSLAQGQSSLQGLLNNQLSAVTNKYDTSNLIKNAAQRGGTLGLTSKTSQFAGQQSLAEVNKALEFFPNIMQQGGQLTPEIIKQLLNSYYNYEDADKGWE